MTYKTTTVQITLEEVETDDGYGNVEMRVNAFLNGEPITEEQSMDSLACLLVANWIKDFDKLQEKIGGEPMRVH